MGAYPLVLLANEPTSYRSLLAAELPFLRPSLRVLEVTPAQLDATVLTYRPSVVICSRAVEAVLPLDCSILRLYADDIDMFIESRDGIIVNPRLRDILSAIDRALTCQPARQQPSTSRKRTLRVRRQDGIPS